MTPQPTQISEKVTIKSLWMTLKMVAQNKESSVTKVKANENSKQSTTSSIYDKYILKHVYKSTETKRKRVSYTCSYEGCSKQYHKRWNLVDHIKTHLGVEPYECDTWGAKFVQKGNLKRHMRQHQMPDLTTRKMFECKICGKSYTENYNLINHMERHKQAGKESEGDEKVWTSANSCSDIQSTAGKAI